ncbi:1550_t:CDS:2 [Acaulospora morrowiae]|uniref:1550_t:CDS:1 n=1 Tax=Acaulospora morrowiae TaxID=94023 RepID=A0A9N9AV67_9GLOM|nr:1550_t:CDS:2 [Acaulospora morrowiae]
MDTQARMRAGNEEFHGENQRGQLDTYHLQQTIDCTDCRERGQQFRGGKSPDDFNEITMVTVVNNILVRLYPTIATTGYRLLALRIIMQKDSDTVRLL